MILQRIFCTSRKFRNGFSTVLTTLISKELRNMIKINATCRLFLESKYKSAPKKKKTQPIFRVKFVKHVMFFLSKIIFIVSFLYKNIEKTLQG